MKNAGTLVDRLKKGEPLPERHHNPYLSEALELGEYLVTNDELRARFETLFTDNTQPLVLEVGCYLGKTVTELAQANPLINVLGVDITYKRTVKAARKLQRIQSPNARIGISEAASLLQFFPAGSLAGVCVFFPDPWPKKKQRKNRLVNAAFFEILKEKLAPRGFFWFKTDSPDYFDDVLAAAHQAQWHVSEPDLQPGILADQPYVTVFEKLFLEKGQPIFRRIFRAEKVGL